MKLLQAFFASLVIAFAFSACGTCMKSQHSHKAASGCCASTKCPPTKDCPAGSACCETKKKS